MVEPKKHCTCTKVFAETVGQSLVCCRFPKVCCVDVLLIGVDCGALRGLMSQVSASFI